MNQFIIYFDQTNNCIISVPDNYEYHLNNSGLKMKKLFTGSKDNCVTFVQGIVALRDIIDQKHLDAADILINNALCSN